MVTHDTIKKTIDSVSLMLLLKAVCIDQAERKKRSRSICSSSSAALLSPSTLSTNVTRHRKWKSTLQQKYTLYKQGHLVRQHEIYNMHENELLTHAHLWYFVHKDPKIERADRIEPKWVVVLRTDDGSYLHPQQPYLTRIYKRLGRTDFHKALTMTADGTPYWVDTHIARICRDKEAKRRYSEKTRREKKRLKK